MGLSLAGTSLANAAYSVGTAEATQLRAVLRSSSVYDASDGENDRNQVVVAAQLSDAAGNTAFKRSGLSLTLALQSNGGYETSAGCSVAQMTGRATCRCTVPSAWFSTSAAGSAIATLRVSYGSELRFEESVGRASLERTPVHSGLVASGMALTLPSSPRFGNDRFVTTASASLIGVTYGLMAWTVTLTYDDAMLNLQSSPAIDSIWGDATTTQETGSIKVLMNCPRDCDSSNTAVTGAGIPIFRAAFRVEANAATGSHAAAVSLRVDAMINFGNNMVVSAQDALVLDTRDGGHNSGTVEVEEAEIVGIFAHFAGGAATLLNTAPLTGVDVSSGISTYTVSTRPHASDYAQAGATCSTGTSSALTVSDCTVRASNTATGGGGVAITISAAGHSVSLSMDVWYPSLSLQLDDGILNKLEGCTDSGDGAYQASRLRVLADGLDVTPLLGTPTQAVSLISMPSSIAELDATSSPAGRVARLLVRGVTLGTGTVSLKHRPEVTVGLVVSGLAACQKAGHASAVGSDRLDRLSPVRAHSLTSRPPNWPLWLWQTRPWQSLASSWGRSRWRTAC